MKKLLIIMLIAGAIGLLFNTTYKLDDLKREYRQQLIVALQEMGLAVSMADDVELLFAPQPCIRVRNISVTYQGNNLLKAQNLAVKLNLFSILTKKAGVISEIQVNNGEIDGGVALQYYRSRSASAQKRMAEIRIAWSGIELVSDGHLLRLQGRIVQNRNSLVISTAVKRDDEATYQVDAMLSDTLSEFKVKGEGIDIEFDGKFNGDNFNGKASVSFSIPDKTVNNSDEPFLTISGLLEMSQDKLLRVKQLQIASPAIKSFKSQLVLDLSQPGQIYGISSISALSLDWDGIIEQFNTQPSSDINDYQLWKDIQLAIKILDFWDLSAVVDLNIQDVHIKNYHLKNAEVTLYWIDNRLLLDKAQAAIEDHGSVNITGVMTHNKIRPEFSGTINASSTNFTDLQNWLQKNLPEGKEISSNYCCDATFTGQFTILPYSFSLDNVTLQIAKSLVKGRAAITKYGSEAPSSLILIDIYNAPLLAPQPLLRSIAQLLYNADYDSSGNAFGRLTNNFSWLRNIEHNLEVHGKLHSSDDDAELLALTLKLSPGIVSLPSIHYKAGDHQLDGTVTLSLPSFRPQVTANLHFTNLSWQNDVLPIFPIAAFNSSAKASKAQLATNAAIAKKIEQEDSEQFNFFSAAHYDADIHLAVDALQSQNFAVNNLDLQFTLNGGVIYPIQLAVQGWGGSILAKMKMILGLDNILQVSSAFDGNKINPEQLLQLLGNNNQISGEFNIGGSLVGEGSSLRDILRYMECDMRFAGTNATVGGVGVDDIVKGVDTKVPLARLRDLLQYYSNYGNTLLSTINGRINVINGIASFSDISFSNARISGSYSANYNLFTDQIDSIALFSFIPEGYDKAIDFEISKKWGANQSPEVYTRADDLLRFVNSR